MENTQSGKNADTPTAKPSRNGCIRFIAHVEREFHKHQAKKEKECTADRMARRTANATVWIAAFTIILAIAGAITLYEVIEGGNDTHKLADATLAASRAWIVIQGTGFGFTQDKSFPTGRVVLADTGNSPAFGIDGWRCAEIRDEEPPTTKGELQRSPTATCVAINGGVLGRNIPITIDTYISATAPPNFAKNTDDLGPHFYLWGTVTYDIYPKDFRHFTNFCLKNGGGQLSSCKENSGYNAN